MTHFVHPKFARRSAPNPRNPRPVGLWGHIASKIAPLFIHPRFAR
jgi:hypothetical protein